VELDDEVQHWLEKVKLTDAANKLSKEYSGGMKRRLSVAIALVGRPKVVLLDEPSTGLDPASRRALWEVIHGFKRQCAMLLTTHSMEEAEALCDRLAIINHGKLRCIGASAELKQRYGQFYKITVTTPEKYEPKAKRFLQKIAPELREINTLAGVAHYEAPREGIKLSTLFSEIQKNQKRLHIIDWGISNTTLEEVFIKIATESDVVRKEKKAETESSSSESTNDKESQQLQSIV